VLEAECAAPDVNGYAVAVAELEVGMGTVDKVTRRPLEERRRPRTRRGLTWPCRGAETRRTWGRGVDDMSGLAADTGLAMAERQWYLS
jgi:hypothetical protein